MRAAEENLAVVWLGCRPRTAHRAMAPHKSRPTKWRACVSPSVFGTLSLPHRVRPGLQIVREPVLPVRHGQRILGRNVAI